MSREGTTPIRSMGVDEAATRLRQGGIGAFPTETLYGIAAVATFPAAVARLVAVKGREPGKPIAVIVDGIPMWERLVGAIPDAARRLAEAFWPGPLTIVLEASADLDPALTGGSGTIGARVSSCSVATALVTATGAPLTAPSANPAGAPPPRKLAQVWDYFGAELDFYIDGGDLPGEPASTVVDLRDGIRVLRAGAIPTAAIESVRRG